MNLCQAIVGLLLILSCSVADAQNLVSNGGFEEYEVCPTIENWPTRFDTLVPGWKTINSCDYFNACGDQMFGVPKNVFDSSEPVAGNAYVGLGFFDTDTGYFEQLYIALSEPLERGATYQISLYAKVTEASSVLNEFQLYFTTAEPIRFRNFYDSYQDSIYLPIDVPKIKYSKKKEWKQIEVKYTATGNESYFLIGALNKDGVTKENIAAKMCSKNKSASKLVQSIDIGVRATYYYIDEVSITKVN